MDELYATSNRYHAAVLLMKDRTSFLGYIANHIGGNVFFIFSNPAACEKTVKDYDDFSLTYNKREKEACLEEISKIISSYS